MTSRTIMVAALAILPGNKGMEDGKLYVRDQRIISFAVLGLTDNSARHKQWYLEQILMVLGISRDALKEAMDKSGMSWEEGIAP